MTRYYTDLKPAEADLSRWTVAHILRGHAERTPDRTWLIAPEEDRELTYAEPWMGPSGWRAGCGPAGPGTATGW